MKRVIYIDPGHGDIGGDFGAVGGDGTREADITLAIAQATKNELIKRKYEVHLSRNSETTSFPIYSESLGDLPFRVEEANKTDAELFISIHCNASESSSASGTEIFYFPGSASGKITAKCILNEVLYLQKIKKAKAKTDKHMLNLWDFTNRGLSEWNFYVLSQTAMPAVLIETLFLSNSEDLELLKTKEFQKFYALAIANGIDRLYVKIPVFDEDYDR